MAGTLVANVINTDTGLFSTNNAYSGIAKAWVNFAGSNGATNGSFNVSSVTRNTTGRYIINFATAMPNTTYATIGTSYEGASNGVITMISATSGSNFYSTTQVGIAVNGATGAQYDPTAVMVMVISS